MHSSSAGWNHLFILCGSYLSRATAEVVVPGNRLCGWAQEGEQKGHLEEMLDESPLVSAPCRRLHPTSHEQNKTVSKCVNVCVCPGLKYCSGAVSEWRCVFV